MLVSLGLPPLVYLQKCVFSFSSGTFGAAVVADATNTKHKLCLFHIVSIWYTWMCIVLCPHKNSYSIKHITWSIQANYIHWNTIHAFLRIDCELAIKRGINNKGKAVKCRMWTNRQAVERTNGRTKMKSAKNPNESTIYSRVLKKNNKWQQKNFTRHTNTCTYRARVKAKAKNTYYDLCKGWNKTKHNHCSCSCQFPTAKSVTSGWFFSFRRL